MIMAASLVHVETRSARHALAFAKAVVTDLAAHAVCFGRHGEKNSDYCCGAEKHRLHFSSWFSFLLKTLFAISSSAAYSTNGQASLRLENSFRTFPQL